MDLNNGDAVWGAIFMSNRSTKKECLHRKLFGLPHSQASIVKQVKVGMMLFLFEYEERKLYGVFEAVSDGAMNIEPQAYQSTGKQFSAQVRFEKIWSCHPLSEPDFRVAIEDNYYTDKKFNFLLSRDQVYSLLHLFSSRKIIQQPSQSSGVNKKLIDQSGFPWLARTRDNSNLEKRSIAVGNKVDVKRDVETVSLSHRGTYGYDYIKKSLDFKESIAKTGAVRGEEHSLPMELYHPSVPHVSHMMHPSLHRERNASDQFYNDSLYDTHDRTRYDPLNPSFDYPISSIPPDIENSSRALEPSQFSRTSEDSIFHPSRVHLYHSPMELGDPAVSSRGYQSALGATSNDDYIGLTSDNDYDHEKKIVPSFGSRYFKQNFTNPVYSGSHELFPEAYESSVATKHPSGTEGFSIEDRGQIPEVFTSVPPPPEDPNIVKRTERSSNPDRFPSAAYEKRRSVFSRLSGMSEDDMALTAGGLMQKLSHRQKEWGVLKTYNLQHAFRGSKSQKKVAHMGDDANIQDRIGLGDDVAVKKEHEAPFFSFKHRRSVHGVDARNQAEVQNEDAGMEMKRRKLVRPSLGLEDSYKGDSGETHNLNRGEETAQDQQVDLSCKPTETQETEDLLVADVVCGEEKRMKSAEIAGENAKGQVQQGDKDVSRLVQECLTGLIFPEAVNVKSADGSVAEEMEDAAACPKGLPEEVDMKISTVENVKEKRTNGLTPGVVDENVEHNTNDEGKGLLHGPAPSGSVDDEQESCEEATAKNGISPITVYDSDKGSSPGPASLGSDGNVKEPCEEIVEKNETSPVTTNDFDEGLLQGRATLGSVNNVKEACEAAGGVDEISPITASESDKVLFQGSAPLGSDGNVKDSCEETVGKNETSPVTAYFDKGLLQGSAPLGNVGNVKVSCEATGGENEIQPITTNHSEDDVADLISLELELNHQT